MKTLKIAVFASVLSVLPAVYAQKGTQVFPPPPPPARPPDYVANPPPAPLSTLQNPAKPASNQDDKAACCDSALVAPDHAKAVVQKFKATYPKLGSPRFLIYVNRELVGGGGGMELTHGTDDAEARPAAASSSTAAAKPAAKSAVDQKTLSDVERLFGGPLRDAGASVADAKVTSQMVSSKCLEDFAGNSDTAEARKNRETLGKVTDAVVEVLVSFKNISVQGKSGSEQVTVPDLQATAINLKDSRILGQASSTDVVSRLPADALATLDVREIAEATALALMEDMTPIHGVDGPVR